MLSLATQPFRRYATFNGRASRREYWCFIAFQIVVSVLLMAAISYQAHHRPPGQMPGDVTLEHVLTYVWLGYMALSALPYYAVTARRFHDLGQSGWWTAALLVPLIGPVYVLLQVVQRGQANDNAYGAIPLR